MMDGPRDEILEKLSGKQQSEESRAAVSERCQPDKKKSGYV